MTLPASRFYTMPWKRSNAEVTAVYSVEKPDEPIVYCLRSADALEVIKELNLQGRYGPKP